VYLQSSGTSAPSYFCSLPKVGAISHRSVVDPQCTRFSPAKFRLARIKATPNTKTLLLFSQFIHTACLNNLRGQAHRAYNWRIIRIGLWLAVL
jgi:hypothetical protein